jgi:hypothetical protein
MDPRTASVHYSLSQASSLPSPGYFHVGENEDSVRHWSADVEAGTDQHALVQLAPITHAPHKNSPYTAASATPHLAVLDATLSVVR